MVQDAWEALMVQFSRRYAERQANMFVVCATTPAQVFHALRRQMNRYAQALTGTLVREVQDVMLPDTHCRSSSQAMVMVLVMLACFSSCTGGVCRVTP